MFRRLLASLVLGFVLGTLGLLLAPDVGRLAGPSLCRGELIPDRERAMRFACVGGDGRLVAAPGEQVLLHTVLICAAAALLPVHLALRRVEEGARRRGQTTSEDLAAARPARAEVLQVAAAGSPKRQLLMRAAELRLTLWVTPPDGRPYEAAVVWFVEQDEIRRLAVGAGLEVRVNPAHPLRVYPAAPWAQLLRWRE